MTTKTKISKIPVLLAFASICAMTIFRNNPIILAFFSLLLGICTGWNIVGIVREYKGFTEKHIILIISLLLTVILWIIYWVIRD